MLVPPQKFIKACGIVQEAFREIDDNSPPPILVLKWQNLVQKRLSSAGSNYKIQISSFEPVRAPDEAQIKGYLLRRNNDAEIFYAENESYCKQRFISAKELAHLLIDGQEAFTKKPSSLMSKLIISGTPMAFIKKDEDQSMEDFESEMLAMMVATEMLVPWKYRNHFDGLCDKGQSPLEIAQVFKVPENVVKNMLTPMYRQFSVIANSVADKQF